jgi:hypothetical protein
VEVNFDATETSFARIAITATMQSTIAAMISGFLFLARILMRLSDMQTVVRSQDYIHLVQINILN